MAERKRDREEGIYWPKRKPCAKLDVKNMVNCVKKKKKKATAYVKKERPKVNGIYVGIY